MQFDMGGAAAVFGAALAIGQLKPPGLEGDFACFRFPLNLNAFGFL